jgi:hypothetical protein
MIPQGTTGIVPLRKEIAGGDMGIAERKPMSTEDEVRALLEEGRISEARRLVESSGNGLPESLRKIFAPPKVTKVDERDVDRTREYRWLKANARRFHGKWVAVAGDDLILSTDTLKELLARLRDVPTPFEPLIHRIP